MLLLLAFSLASTVLYSARTFVFIVTGRGPARCAWLFFFMIVLLFEIFLNVLVLKLHYICINNILYDS